VIYLVRADPHKVVVPVGVPVQINQLFSERDVHPVTDRYRPIPFIKLTGAAKSASPHIRLVNHVENDVRTIRNTLRTVGLRHERVTVCKSGGPADLQVRPAEDVVTKVRHLALGEDQGAVPLGDPAMIGAMVV
jgi:hypothetical protein